MSLGNEIVLRPRFQMELQQDHASALNLFEAAKYSQKRFVISRVDNHVFIRLPKQDQHFWSPQLHLEILDNQGNGSILKGLFGPNPTVWTMFMFFHFMVAGLFIAFGIWAYSNHALGITYNLQIAFMLFMVVLWFVLYFAGRMGKRAGKDEMMEMQTFMTTVLQS